MGGWRGRGVSNDIIARKPEIQKQLVLEGLHLFNKAKWTSERKEEQKQSGVLEVKAGKGFWNLRVDGEEGEVVSINSPFQRVKGGTPGWLSWLSS